MPQQKQKPHNTMWGTKGVCKPVFPGSPVDVSCFKGFQLKTLTFGHSLVTGILCLWLKLANKLRVALFTAFFSHGEEKLLDSRVQHLGHWVSLHSTMAKQQ